jgi:hypothetical protein
VKLLVFFWLFFTLDERTATLIDQVTASGQIVDIATPAAERLSPSARISPGAPPAVSFRLIEGKLRHRFGDLDLVLDDAGH